MKPILLTLCIVLTATLLVRPASSCLMTTPITKEMEASAQTVFCGTVSGYKLITAPSSGKGTQPLQFARIKFTTVSTLRGETKKQWEVNWMNGNFGVPKTLAEFNKTYGSAFEVGLINHGTDKYLSAETYKEFPAIYASFGNFPSVVQGPCTTPYLKPITLPL